MGSLTHTDEGGQDHDAQQDGGSQDALAAAAEQIPHDGHDHHQAEEAIDNGGNASQQIHCRLEVLIDTGRAEPGQIYGTQQSHRHTDDQRSGSDIDTAQNHREDAIDIVGGFPGGTQQEIERTDLRNGGKSIRKQEQTNYNYSEYRSKGRD